MELTPLCEGNLLDLACLPGGLELAGKSFLGDLSCVTKWHRERLAEGLQGVVAYASGKAARLCRMDARRDGAAAHRGSGRLRTPVLPLGRHRSPRSCSPRRRTTYA